MIGNFRDQSSRTFRTNHLCRHRADFPVDGRWLCPSKAIGFRQSHLDALELLGFRAGVLVRSGIRIAFVQPRHRTCRVALPDFRRDFVRPDVANRAAYWRQ